MPINDFDEDTFVAFLDISGFKQLMKDEKKALNALDRLYQYGYEVLQEKNRQVEGIFISDSGILFVRNCQDKNMCLRSLLAIIREINKKMLKHDLILTTSIAYGHFKYQERIEFEGIEKNPIYGNAYVAAFLDNENGKPKIQPGQCRIVKKNLPNEVEELLEGNYNQYYILQLVRGRNNGDDHNYFYWMVKNPAEIDDFEKQYTDAYNLKYAGMLRALKSGGYERHFR
ncbi:MAG TPA: hypothetical protein EYP67_00670 [Methanosarcinales archaeon]|nr:hypothetical protein [Methanosarcinales archaeon]